VAESAGQQKFTDWTFPFSGKRNRKSCCGLFLPNFKTPAEELTNGMLTREG